MTLTSTPAAWHADSYHFRMLALLCQSFGQEKEGVSSSSWETTPGGLATTRSKQVVTARVQSSELSFRLGSLDKRFARVSSIVSPTSRCIDRSVSFARIIYPPCLLRTHTQAKCPTNQLVRSLASQSRCAQLSVHQQRSLDGATNIFLTTRWYLDRGALVALATKEEDIYSIFL